MLVLARHIEESITLVIGDVSILVQVIDIGNGRVRLGIEAPRRVSVTRTELIGTPRGLPRCRPSRPGFGEGLSQ